MRQGLEQQKLAVQSGYWPLFRYNPDAEPGGQEPAAARFQGAEPAAGEVHLQRDALHDDAGGAGAPPPPPGAGGGAGRGGGRPAGRMILGAGPRRPREAKPTTKPHPPPFFLFFFLSLSYFPSSLLFNQEAKSSPRKGGGGRRGGGFGFFVGGVSYRRGALGWIFSLLSGGGVRAGGAHTSRT